MGRLLDGVSNGGHAGWEVGGHGTARLPFTLVGNGPLTTTEPAIIPGCGRAAARPVPASVRVSSHHRTVTQGRHHSRLHSARKTSAITASRHDRERAHADTTGALGNRGAARLRGPSAVRVQPGAGPVRGDGRKARSGLPAELGDRFHAYGSYNADLRRDATGHTLSAGLRYRWQGTESGFGSERRSGASPCRVAGCAAWEAAR
ncbi:hypothetical protein Sp245p_14720 (plasmid) [Azospirillum baldaniorum]|uniref:Uncharacterized protein n=1 Tax=Azospirillum baldaniorum TaxID=1064539 RepID=A0A9P1JWM0_9PROT|nr:hypothetical protein Sp245p_14720 [Azospirillum baldaniorum]CCD01149.1 protein of unknown function [Azospirillum baldaniorum]